MGLTANSVLTSVEVFDGRLRLSQPVRNVRAGTQRANGVHGRRYAFRAAPLLAMMLVCALSPVIPHQATPHLHWSQSLTHAVQTVTPQALRRHQHVDVTDDLCGAQVAGDGARLERALVNMLGNAVKFTSDGGSIALTASSDGEFVSVAISDTGPGIAGNDQHRIFDRMYRAPREGSEDAPGFGLGLAIVEAVVTEHAGTKLDSALGRSSTFTSRLPLLSC